MPGNIQNATPNGVMPCALCTAFSESREYAQFKRNIETARFSGRSSRRLRGKPSPFPSG